MLFGKLLLLFYGRSYNTFKLAVMSKKQIADINTCLEDKKLYSAVFLYDISS